MSRSRKKVKHGKCICGLGLVKFLEYGRRGYEYGCSNPLMEDVFRHNQEFLKYKKTKKEPISERLLTDSDR